MLSWNRWCYVAGWDRRDVSSVWSCLVQCFYRKMVPEFDDLQARVQQEFFALTLLGFAPVCLVWEKHGKKASALASENMVNDLDQPRGCRGLNWREGLREGRRSDSTREELEGKNWLLSPCPQGSSCFGTCWCWSSAHSSDPIHSSSAMGLTPCSFSKVGLGQKVSFRLLSFAIVVHRLLVFSVWSPKSLPWRVSVTKYGSWCNQNSDHLKRAWPVAGEDCACSGSQDGSCLLILSCDLLLVWQKTSSSWWHGRSTSW